MLNRIRPETAPVPTGAGAPHLLVSVRDAAEAQAACLAGAGLVDAKDPARGALGALAPALVRAMADAVAGRAVTSAVAGEPTDAASLCACVAAMAETGVDYVKVAVVPSLRGDEAALAAAARAAPGRVIAVLFAEDGGAAAALPRLAAAGFAGAMIDTGGKDGRRLTDWIMPDDLAAFTAACRRHGLVSGLAGSLSLADVPALTGVGADYLGFRGGLCRGGDRKAGLDPARIDAVIGALGHPVRRDAA